MPRRIAALLLAACLCMSNLASARADQGDILGVSREQALVVGAGIVGGALVTHLVAPGDFTYFASGVLGGIAALWWYENGGERQLHPVLRVDRATLAANPRGRLVLDDLAVGR
jgi:hypothetical protein